MPFHSDLDDDDNEITPLSNSVPFSQRQNSCEQIETESSALNPTTDAPKIVVETLISDLQLQQAIIDLAIGQDEHIRNDDIKVPISTDMTVKFEPKTENPPVKQMIVEEIDLTVTVACEPNGFAKKASPKNMPNNGLENGQVNDNCETKNAANNETTPDAVLRLSDAGKCFSSSGEAENIYTIVHDVMAVVDELFECVF